MGLLFLNPWKKTASVPMLLNTLQLLPEPGQPLNQLNHGIKMFFIFLPGIQHQIHLLLEQWFTG
jgi:hypothetical protein